MQQPLTGPAKPLRKSAVLGWASEVSIEDFCQLGYDPSRFSMDGSAGEMPSRPCLIPRPNSTDPDASSENVDPEKLEGEVSPPGFIGSPIMNSPNRAAMKQASARIDELNERIYELTAEAEAQKQRMHELSSHHEEELSFMQAEMLAEKQAAQALRDSLAQESTK